MGEGRRGWGREGNSRLSSAGQWARRGDWVPLSPISSPFPRAEKDAGRGAREEAPANPPTNFSAKRARWKAEEGGADGRVRCCRQRQTRVSARVSSPRRPRRGTAFPKGRVGRAMGSAPRVSYPCWGRRQGEAQRRCSSSSCSHGRSRGRRPALRSALAPPELRRDEEAPPSARGAPWTVSSARPWGRGGGYSRWFSAGAATAGGLSPARPDGGFPTLGRTRRGVGLAGSSWPLAPTPSAGRASEPAPRLSFTACRSRTRRQRLRWKPGPKRGRCRSWAGWRQISRESLVLPAPPPPLPGSPPGPRLVPGAVTSWPGVRLSPASRCGERKREESGGVAVSPPPWVRNSWNGSFVWFVALDGYKEFSLIGKVSLGCPTFRGGDVVLLSAEGDLKEKRQRERVSPLAFHLRRSSC